MTDQIIQEVKDYLFPMVRKSFKEELFDIVVTESSLSGFSFNVDLIIYFPQLTIQGHSEWYEDEDDDYNDDRLIYHYITDLYVKTELSGRKTDEGEFEFIIHNFRGLRTSFDLDEWVSRYIHSHLPTLDTDNVYFADFCLGGSDTPMSRAISNLSYPEDWSELKFESFITLIPNYLCWESSEGGPYIYIKDIYLSIESSDILYPKDDAYNAYLRIKDLVRSGDLVDFPANYTWYNDSIFGLAVDERDPKFIKIASDFSERKGETSSSGRFTLSQKTDDGVKLEMYRNALDRAMDLGSVLSFKGHSVGITVYEPDTYNGEDVLTCEPIDPDPKTVMELANMINKRLMNMTDIKSGNDTALHRSAFTLNSYPSRIINTVMAGRDRAKRRLQNELIYRNNKNGISAKSDVVTYDGRYLSFTEDKNTDDSSYHPGNAIHVRDWQKESKSEELKLKIKQENEFSEGITFERSNEIRIESITSEEQQREVQPNQRRIITEDEFEQALRDLEEVERNRSQG
jgi:hypothetical protein